MASGKELKKFIKKKNISVAELSRKTKIPQQTLYSAINRDSCISIETLKKIAFAINVSVYELIEEISDKIEDVNMYQLGYNNDIDDFAEIVIAELQKAKHEIKLCGNDLDIYRGAMICAIETVKDLRAKLQSRTEL